MKLYYYKGPVSNFGDHLNEWLWPKLIPEVLSDNGDDGVFVGIGTLINTKIPEGRRVIILSSGVGYGDLPKEIPATWHYYGVRGPISAEILGDWAEVCREAGINFIDPRGAVDDVFEQIRSTEKMICASMHGAILADAFRVPWVAVRAFGKGHLRKWSDWAGALDMEVRFAQTPASSFDERLHDFWPRLRNLFRRLTPVAVTPAEKTVRLSRLVKRANRALVQRAARSLLEVSKTPSQLSSDAAIERATARLLESVARLRRDYAGGFASSDPSLTASR